jgi:uracil-DNA glycosylase
MLPDVPRKHQLLLNLQKEVESCKRCYISQQGPCRVFGEGPADALVMSISEAAGEAEQRAGLPYQGSAGKYWAGMLSSAGFLRENLYVTNVIKGRPMYGGKSNAISPNYDEVHACQPFLFRQLEIIQPKLILVFGKVAAYSLGLLKKADSFGKILGEIPLYEYACSDGIKRQAKIICVYHPSYLMRANKERENWLSYIHLCRAKEILDGLVSG